MFEDEKKRALPRKLIHLFVISQANQFTGGISVSHALDDQVTGLYL